MKHTEFRHIRTGGDPRPFPDFAALRDEMSKQTHPARPDIYWDRVEQLSLALFEKNGVELQTAAWYTLARSHLARVGGMSEGLNIIAAMLSHQWTQFWPQASHSRAEILCGLFQRLQKVFRTFTLSHADYSQLQHLESTLESLSGILSRHELQQVSQIAPLLQQVRSALTRVEHSPESEASMAAITLPAEPQLQYVIEQEQGTNVEVIYAKAPASKRISIFLSGMLAAFALNAFGYAGWHYLTLPDESQQLLDRSLQSLPRLPDATVIDALKSYDKKDLLAASWLKGASARLNALSALPPDWNLRYGQQLINQAQTLWPGLSGTKQLSDRWQHKLALNAAQDESLAGWHQGMIKLQNLSEQLNALDGQRGKYLTVSELKSQVFTAIQTFNASVPVEEQLRQLAEQQASGTIPDAQKLQAKQHLQQLVIRYSMLTNRNKPVDATGVRAANVY